MPDQELAMPDARPERNIAPAYGTDHPARSSLAAVQTLDLKRSCPSHIYFPPPADSPANETPGRPALLLLLLHPRDRPPPPARAGLCVF